MPKVSGVACSAAMPAHSNEPTQGEPVQKQLPMALDAPVVHRCVRPPS